MARAFLVLLLVGLAGCAQYKNTRGVEVTWSEAPRFTIGETTRADVLKALGPPSQVVALGDETVLYYLREQGEGEALILGVYNRFRLDQRYDRAIYFFDGTDTLSDQSSFVQPVSD